ncbi:N-acetyltransferase [Xylanimonas oleitrophica]|uniref:N-acetyltransferase n=1 Tax=Xylanimonas oleitrophica TaxID=2607479 RepID=A0A2W5WRD5_9MICO|nr:N-acetyltransferase [Xylanimonas oleitrophica]
MREVTTDRLRLTPVSPSDLDELFALHADPRVWTHLPSGRHLDRERTARDIAAYQEDWERHGIGYWTARRLDDGTLVGVGGVRLVLDGQAWNTYYRVHPDQQGNGFATAVARAGHTAAAALRPELPVIAYLLEHNAASRATAERLGLSPVWRGPDVGNPDPDAVRLVYADRPLDPELLGRIARR